jgi:hypothetical protein
MLSFSRRRELFLLVLVCCAVLAPLVLRPRHGSGMPRSAGSLRELVVMLDGVPYEVMDSLWQAGHFRAFHTPARLISPFPSLTDVAFRSIWGDPPGPGYEDRYFDPKANRMVGGLAEMLHPQGVGGQYRQAAVAPGGWTEGFAYLFPRFIARGELSDVRRALEGGASSDSSLAAYILSTDALAHRSGREALVAFLLELEGVLEAARARHGEELKVLLFSDHGNDLIPTRRIPLERVLKRAGFRPTDRIREENDVVLPRFGLVSSAFLYCRPGVEPRLADALVKLEGVDLIFYEDAAGVIHVLSGRGRAVVEERGGKYRYLPVEGDPLELAPALASLRESGELDVEGFAPDAAWYRQSLGSRYIDALHRIVAGTRDGVRHPANLVVSLEPGYHFGDPAANALVSLTGTHGSLRTDASLAFFMSTHDSTPAVLRSDSVRRYLPGKGAEPAPEAP